MNAPSPKFASPQAETLVKVSLAERSYDIIIGAGALSSLGERIAALRPGARTAVVTDRTVAKHWLRQTEAALQAANVPSARIVVGEGESSKSYDGLQQVAEALIAAK